MEEREGREGREGDNVWKWSKNGVEIALLMLYGEIVGTLFAVEDQRDDL